jgi:hypothetical protein
MSEQEPEQRYTLQEAAARFWGGKITKRTLRKELRRHNVQIERLGNKDFVTASDIEALRKSIRGKEGSCHAEDYPPASSCEKPGPTESPTGALSTERKRLALASARTTLKALKQHSRNTSALSIDRPAENVVPLICSSTK